MKENKELAIVTSDIHIHTYKQFNENNRRLKNGIGYLNYLFKLAVKNGINYILLPGDLTNNMQIIAVKVVNAIAICLKKNFEIYPQIKIIAIPGNHDFAEKNLTNFDAESALEHLFVLFPDNFILLDKYGSLFVTEQGHVIRGIPYFEYPEHFINNLSAVAADVSPFKEGHNNFLLTHQVIASGLPIEDTIQPNSPFFDKFDMVFNGHIHNNEQITDKFINVGSPMHRDTGDIGKTKGFWIVDLSNPVETIAFKDITNKYPQFIHKFIGEELTEEEKEQYIIWVPNTITENVNQQQLSEKFNTNLNPAIIMENYCREVLPENEVEEKLKYGVTLL